MKVTSIGSCRIYDPLMLAGKELSQEGVAGFSHNTKEHLQLLRSPPALPPDEMLSTITCLPRKRPVVPCNDPARFFVVEISSIRVLRYGDWFLQINRFFTYVSGVAGAQYNALSFKSQEALRDGLRGIPTLPLNADELEFYEQSEDEVYADALKIKEILGGRVLFVCHWDTDRHGRLIPQRTTVRRALARLAIDHDAFVLDPTPYVKQHGNAFADLGHFSEEFKTNMANILGNRLAEIASCLPGEKA